MIKKKRHRLPKFPAAVIPTFKRLCEALPASDLEAYKADIEVNLERIRAAASTNDRVDLERGEQLGRVSKQLLDRYESFNENQRALVIGAIRYFAVAEDAASETTFATGFDDDVKVMNHVLEEIGLIELAIELP